MKQTFLIAFGAVLLMAQSSKIITLTDKEATVLQNAYEAQIKARAIADQKYDEYYALAQQIRRAHQKDGCGVFTEGFRFYVTGAYSGLNSGMGTLTTSACR